MSNDMQTAILARIDTLPRPGVTVRHVEDWANTGQLYVQRDFTTLVRLAYDFQNTRFTVAVADLDPSEVPEHLRVGLHTTVLRPGGGKWRGWLVDYDDGPAIDRVLLAVAQLIADRSAVRRAHATAPTAQS